jgi:hypothetical protein
MMFPSWEARPAPDHSTKARVHPGVEARGDDEPGPGLEGGLSLVHGQDRPGPDDELRDLGGQGGDGLVGPGGAEGDLGQGQPPGQEGPAQGHGLPGVVELDHRDQPVAPDGVEDRIH